MPSGFTSEGLWVGNVLAAELNETYPATIEVDKGGKVTATLTYQCLWEYVADVISMIAQARTHPDFSFLYFEKISGQREEAGLTLLTVNYTGIVEAQNSEGGNGRLPGDTWSLEGSLEDKPIAAHPQADAILVADKGALFDGEGNFIKFSDKLDGAANPKAGVTTYLESGAILTRTTTARNTTSSSVDAGFGKLGKIDNPANKPDWLPASAPDDRNWMLVSLRVEELGEEGTRTSYVWKLSGRGGYDDDLYAYISP